MKAYLSFNLPEEEVQHMDAIKGGLYKIVLQELDNHLRARIKYETLEEIVYQSHQELRDKLHELCNQYNANLWE